MADREIVHLTNPRATRINYGTYHSGIQIELTRSGVEVFGYYDGCVGIGGGFITWEEFDRLRAAAFLTVKRGKEFAAE